MLSIWGDKELIDVESLWGKFTSGRNQRMFIDLKLFLMSWRFLFDKSVTHKLMGPKTKDPVIPVKCGVDYIFNLNGKKMIYLRTIIYIPILNQEIASQWFSHNKLRGINVEKAIKIITTLKNSQTPCIDLRIFWSHHIEIWLGIYNFKELLASSLQIPWT